MQINIQIAILVCIDNRTTTFKEMKNRNDLPVESALKKMAGTTAVAVAGAALSHRLSAAESVLEEKLKGKVNHSVCRWCYNDIPLEDLCKAANQSA